MSVARMRGPALALRAGGGKAEAVMASGATSGPRWRAGVSDEVGQLIGGAVVQAGPLPVLDATVRRLVAVLEDASSSTAEAVAMVEQDPEFAAQLLRLANSAYYARRSTWKTVRQALAAVGRAAAVRLCLRCPADPTRCDRGAVWVRRSLRWG